MFGSPKEKVRQNTAAFSGKLAFFQTEFSSADLPRLVKETGIYNENPDEN